MVRKHTFVGYLAEQTRGTEVSVLGWIFTVGIFLFGMSATYPVAGLGGSVLAGGFLALLYMARAARPSARPQPPTLDAYGRAVLGNLLDEFARVPDPDAMYHQNLVQRGRAPVDREQVGLIRLAALMQRCHENPIGDKDYAAMSANSEAMRSTFKLIYGHDSGPDENWAFTNMISGAYATKGSASVSAAAGSISETSDQTTPGRRGPS